MLIKEIMYLFFDKDVGYGFDRLSFILVIGKGGIFVFWSGGWFFLLFFVCYIIYFFI